MELSILVLSEHSLHKVHWDILEHRYNNISGNTTVGCHQVDRSLQIYSPASWTMAEISCSFCSALSARMVYTASCPNFKAKVFGST